MVEEKDRRDDADLAPISPDVVRRLPGQPAKALPVKLENTERKKTKGEVVFDWTVYAGIMWILNEVLSTVVAHRIIPDPEHAAQAAVKATDKGLKRWLKETDAAVTKTLNKTYTDSIRWLDTKLLRKKESAIDNEQLQKGWKIYQSFLLPVEMFVYTIGGNMLVPLAKLFEDNKGNLVRHADRVLDHDKSAKHQAELAQQHKAMDDAPQQTWTSMWEGRLWVLATAIGLHLTVGARNAATTNFFKPDNFMDGWSSLQRASVSFTRVVAKAIFPSKAAAVNESIASEKFRHVINKETEGKFMKFVGTNAFVLMISGACAGLFYVTSKFFAKKQDEKKDREEETRTGTANLGFVNEASATEAPGKNKDDRPSTSVSRISRAEHMANVAHIEQLHASH